METCNWNGYSFGIYNPGGNWNDTPGLYIFAYRGTDGLWRALYIGQTESFRARLPNHERWADAVRYGATHIHAMTETNAVRRSMIERQLIAVYRPPLNEIGIS